MIQIDVKIFTIRPLVAAPGAPWVPVLEQPTSPRSPYTLLGFIRAMLVLAALVLMFH
jgi:hypothetical protein